MKQVSYLICAAALLLTISSCKKIVGEGPVVTETRDPHTFEGLSLSVPAEAYFSIAPDYSLTLQAQQNILDEIETVVINDVLKIRFRDPNTRITNREAIIIHVTGPDANLLETNGSGKLEVEGVIAPAELKMFVSGSGSIHVDKILSNKIETIISGSGRIQVDDGQANQQRITISGSGFADLSALTVKDVDATISGSGETKVYPTSTLKVKISGSGTVYYKGSPSIQSQISGSGSLVKI